MSFPQGDEAARSSRLIITVTVLGFVMNISLVIIYGYGYVSFTENIHHLNQENSELKTAMKIMQEKLEALSPRSYRFAKLNKRCMLLANPLNFKQSLTTNSSFSANIEEKLDSLETQINGSFTQSVSLLKRIDGLDLQVSSLQQQTADNKRELTSLQLEVLINKTLANFAANSALIELQKQVDDAVDSLKQKDQSLDKAIAALTKKNEQHPLRGPVKVYCDNDGNYKYNPYSRTCVRHYRKKLQWKAASAECKKSGMRLVTVDSADTAYWLRQQLIAESLGSIWTAGYKRGNRWLWDGGLNPSLPVSIGFWAKNEPSNNGQAITLHSTLSYYFDDEDEHVPHPFFCERISK